MSGYRLTPAAQQDLSTIWDFTEDRWGVAQAERYIREIQAAVERLVDDPNRGRARDAIRSGFRSYAVGSHVLFYLVGANHIEVIRVLHQRMDFGRHL